MTRQGDDVGALFKSFGADDGGFRELARKADASEAEERWPLLKSIAPEKREAPPALSNLQKNQLWNSEEKPAPRAREASRGLPSLGEKLGRSLQQMSARVVPDAPATRPAARAVPDAPATRPAKRAAAETPRQPALPASSLFAPKPKPLERTRENSLFARPAVPKSARPASKGRGLFSQSEPAPAPAQHKPAAGSVGDSLASAFKRLAGNEETVAETSNSRPSFLRRLGRG